MKKILLSFILTLGVNLYATSSQISNDLTIPNSDAISTEKFLTTLKGLAETGGVGANYTLGSAYLIGNESLNIEQDFQKAAEYFKKDAETLSMASYKLGEIYAYNLLKEKNVCECNDKALKWFLKSVENKETMDYKMVAPIANAAVGTIYLNNQNKPLKALPYLETAANLKNLPKIELVVGLIYNDSKLGVYNEEKANYWLNRAWKNRETTPELRRVIMNFAEKKKK